MGIPLNFGNMILVLGELLSNLTT